MGHNTSTLYHVSFLRKSPSGNTGMSQEIRNQSYTSRFSLWSWLRTTYFYFDYSNTNLFPFENHHRKFLFVRSSFIMTLQCQSVNYLMMDYRNYLRLILLKYLGLNFIIFLILVFNFMPFLYGLLIKARYNYWGNFSYPSADSGSAEIPWCLVTWSPLVARLLSGLLSKLVLFLRQL